MSGVICVGPLRTHVPMCNDLQDEPPGIPPNLWLAVTFDCSEAAYLPRCTTRERSRDGRVTETGE